MRRRTVWTVVRRADGRIVTAQLANTVTSALLVVVIRRPTAWTVELGRTTLVVIVALQWAICVTSGLVYVVLRRRTPWTVVSRAVGRIVTAQFAIVVTSALLGVVIP